VQQNRRTDIVVRRMLHFQWHRDKKRFVFHHSHVGLSRELLKDRKARWTMLPGTIMLSYCRNDPTLLPQVSANFVLDPPAKPLIFWTAYYMRTTGQYFVGECTPQFLLH